MYKIKSHLTLFNTEYSILGYSISEYFILLLKPILNFIQYFIPITLKKQSIYVIMLIILVEFFFINKVFCKNIYIIVRAIRSAFASFAV